MGSYKEYIDEAHKALSELNVARGGGAPLRPEEGLDLWVELTEELNKSNRTMYFAGNGASASMASHMSADATKNGKIKSQAFNDISLLTAVSNDISYEQSFAFPLERFADREDILVTISSSGNSPNIVAALNAAREMGVKTITLSGMSAENRSRSLGDLNFHIPNPEYGIVECTHQILLHCWLDTYMERMGLEIGA